MTKKAKILFLGSGGGRFVVTQQLRASGGLVIEMDNEMLYIDPGPGALVRSKQNKINLLNLTGVFVSHCHPDHYADVELVIEAMSHCRRKIRGVFYGSESVIKGGDGFYPRVSKYHLDRLDKYGSLKSGDTVSLGKIKITATPTKHAEPKGIGFVFSGTNKIGYTSDGEYFKGQEDYFKDCDCLIINCLRPRNDNWPMHMNASGAKKLIELTKPKMAVLTHFGMKMLKGVAEKEAAWIQKETGITTIAAKDNMKLNFADIGSLKKFI